MPAICSFHWQSSSICSLPELITGSQPSSCSSSKFATQPGKVPRADDEEMTLQEVADQLGTHWQTVYGWLRRGTLKGRLAHLGKQRIWLVKLAGSPAARVKPSD